MIGQALSHYKITAKLGEGGMGEVYLAEDTRLEREVAIKVLPAEMAADPERLERFKREAHTLAAVDHPNIVHIYSVESDGDVHFLTMQLIRGRSLTELIPEDGMELDQFLELAIPLADALRAAHDKGIVHRDLKSENVMVDKAGRLKVLDFGLAKLRQSEPVAGDSQLPTQALTQEGLVLGTVPYMSPEQIQGRPIDHRTDLFSLGILFYEMLCGQRPFGGDSSASIISSILYDTPELSTEISSGLPPKLVELVNRCLEKNPASRIQSAKSLREVQQETTAGRAISATKSVSTLSNRRMRWIASLGAAALIALLAGLALWLTQHTESGASNQQISSLAVLPLQNLSGDPDQDYFADGMTEALITDLSKIGALKVISRTSVMQYKNTNKTPAQIADELDVEALIQGSVLRQNHRVAITVQLIEAASDRNLWAERYERDVNSILAVQSEIAQEIAQEIEIALTPEEKTRIANIQNVDPAAFDAYLQGMFYLRRLTPQDIERAQQYFETALEIDPQYALAHLGLGRVWIYAVVLGTATPREVSPLAVESVSRAIELDESLAEAHLSLANLNFSWLWDWSTADAEYNRAIELNPNYAEAHIFYSHFLATQRRLEESALHIERALQLDPLEPFFQAMYGVQLQMSGKNDDAVRQFRTLLEQAPGLGFAYYAFFMVLNQAGLHEEAIPWARAHFELVGEAATVEALDRGYMDGGVESAMMLGAETLEESSHTATNRPIHIVCLFDQAGDVDRALDWLEISYEVRDIEIPYLAGVGWYSEQLYNHPRFQDLLRRLQLPPYSP